MMKGCKRWIVAMGCLLFIWICIGCTEQSPKQEEQSDTGTGIGYEEHPGSETVTNPGTVEGAGLDPGGSAGQSNTPSSPSPSEPVSDRLTLRFLDTGNMPAALFQKEVVEPLKHRFPQYELQYLAFPADADSKTYFATHAIPDIIYGPLHQLDMLVAQEVLAPIPGKFFPATNQVESAVASLQGQSNLPVAVGAEAIGAGGHIFGMMPKLQNGSLYYNINLFDKFGVDYPSEGMTWSDTFDLAKRLTREEGGVFYQGFQSDYEFLLDRYSRVIPYVDAESKQSNLSKEEWSRWLTFFKSFYEIMGNEFVDETMDKLRNRFMVDQTVAMWAGNYIYPQIPKNTFDWDVVPLPTFEEQVEVNTMPTEWSHHFFGIGNTERYEEEAGSMIAALFTRPSATGGGIEMKQEYRKVLLGLSDVNSAIRRAEEIMELARKRESGSGS